MSSFKLFSLYTCVFLHTQSFLFGCLQHVGQNSQRISISSHCTTLTPKMILDASADVALPSIHPPASLRLSCKFFHFSQTDLKNEHLKEHQLVKRDPEAGKHLCEVDFGFFIRPVSYLVTLGVEFMTRPLPGGD